jgi:hypothetical protein
MLMPSVPGKMRMKFAIEMRFNQAAWRKRPHLRKVYGHFYLPIR